MYCDQVSQHIEFEADWESGFNLHLKLAPVMALLLRWCQADRVIFIKAYKMLVKAVRGEVEGGEPGPEHEVRLAEMFTRAAQFSVATEPVSLHLPLCRLLAAMSLSLDTFGLCYTTHDFKLGEGELCNPSHLLELPLRTSVMVSQVHAGMWRRNGYSLQHQIFFYHNARCRGEMYDRDIQTLQFCAANMDQDSFLLQLLDRFDLVRWAEPDFQVAEEESIRHLTSLVEELFGLLVTLVGERFSPGVGQVTMEEMVRKEIVQLLCVEPMSHSALNKSLPEDVNHETGLEKVIGQVATFKKPTGHNSKGVYELKPEYYKEYNVFFYHFTREDQSKSEESQRARLKAAGAAQVCPPPALPALTTNYAGLTELQQSSLMIHLLTLVLKRADDLKSRCFSEAQVHKVLYLIGMGLMEEERLRQADPASTFEFSRKARAAGLLKAMEALTGSARIDSHKELLAWTVRKFKLVSGLEVEKMEVSDETEEDDEAKKKRAKAAAERRKKIMAQMASQQKNFMSENATLFDETPSGLRERLVSTTEWEEETVDSSAPVCLGPHRSQPAAAETAYTCILCQEEEQLAADNNPLVMASYVQKSTVLSRDRSLATATAILGSTATFPFLPASLSSAPHTSSCGHVMHAACWQKYFDDVSESERRRYRSRHPTSFDVEKSEFLCPLCRSLSNSVIPLIPQYHLLQQPQPAWTAPASLSVMELCEEEAGSEVMLAEQESCAMEEGGETATSLPGPATAITTSSSASSTGLESAVSSSVTVVRSASPASSHSSSSTELASAHSLSSDLTFMSAPDSPQQPDQEPACPPAPRVVIDFSQWLEALFIALQYRRSLSPEPAGAVEGAEGGLEQELSGAGNLTRYYTCPLDQVVEELDQKHQDGASFARLFAVEDGCELAFPATVYEMMNSFSQTTFRVGLETAPHLQDERIPLMVWQSCGFTVRSIVVSALDAEKPLFGSLSSRQNDCLSALIRFCGVVGSNFGEPKVVRSHSLKLLTTLLEADPTNPSLLELDMLGLLTSLTFSLPSLFNGEGPAPLPSCNTQDSHVLRLVFLAHLTQLLFPLCGAATRPARPELRQLPARDCRPLQDLLAVVEAAVGSGSRDPVSVWQDLMEQSLGFLRSAALFYHYLSGVAAPVELTSLLPPDQEFLHLAKYLSLPSSPRTLLDSPFCLLLANKWAGHPGVRAQLARMPAASLSFATTVPQLIPLPEDFSDLINNISSFSCPRSMGEESRIPSM